MSNTDVRYKLLIRKLRFIARWNGTLIIVASPLISATMFKMAKTQSDHLWAIIFFFLGTVCGGVMLLFSFRIKEQNGRPRAEAMHDDLGSPQALQVGDRGTVIESKSLLN